MIFRGSGPPFDAGAIRVTNPSPRTLTVNDVSVDIGSVHYDLWGPYPILVPTGEIAVVKVVIGRKHLQTKAFLDVGQVVNTGGIDSGTCQGGSEGHPWERVLPRGR